MPVAQVGGDGICYTVRIGNNVTYLFYEDPRWFVEEVVKDGMSARNSHFLSKTPAQSHCDNLSQ